MNPTVGLPMYTDVAISAPRGQQWLAARLAHEQQELGLFEPQTLEVDFLQGMVYYREGRYREAEPLLRRVADFRLPRIEVAIALHIVGRLDGRRNRIDRAEAELNRSLEIRKTLGDALGEAHVLHTLGRLLYRNQNPAGGRDERR